SVRPAWEGRSEKFGKTSVSAQAQNPAKSDPASRQRAPCWIALQVECFHDVMLVELDGFLAQIQMSGDFFDGTPFRAQLDNIALPRREFLPLLARARFHSQTQQVARIVHPLGCALPRHFVVLAQESRQPQLLQVMFQQHLWSVRRSRVRLAAHRVTSLGKLSCDGESKAM